MERAKVRFGLADGPSVVSCYEAGREGSWPHRFLASKGIEKRVVDAASIEVSRPERCQLPRTSQASAVQKV